MSALVEQRHEGSVRVVAHVVVAIAGRGFRARQGRVFHRALAGCGVSAAATVADQGTGQVGGEELVGDAAGGRFGIAARDHRQVDVFCAPADGPWSRRTGSLPVRPRGCEGGGRGVGDRAPWAAAWITPPPRLPPKSGSTRRSCRPERPSPSRGRRAARRSGRHRGVVSGRAGPWSCRRCWWRRPGNGKRCRLRARMLHHRDREPPGPMGASLPFGTRSRAVEAVGAVGVLGGDFEAVPGRQALRVDFRPEVGRGGRDRVTQVVTSGGGFPAACAELAPKARIAASAARIGSLRLFCRLRAGARALRLRAFFLQPVPSTGLCSVLWCSGRRYGPLPCRYGRRG